MNEKTQVKLFGIGISLLLILAGIGNIIITASFNQPIGGILSGPMFFVGGFMLYITLRKDDK
jgi:hypothetical protein